MRYRPSDDDEATHERPLGGSDRSERLLAGGAIVVAVLLVGFFCGLVWIL